MPSTRGIQVALHRLACDVSESEAKNRAIEALQFMRIPATSNGFSSLARGQQKEEKAESLMERERGEQHFADVSKISSSASLSTILSCQNSLYESNDELCKVAETFERSIFSSGLILQNEDFRIITV